MTTRLVTGAAVVMFQYVLPASVVGLSLLIGAAALVAVMQERKLWRPAGVPTLSLWGCLKVWLFNVTWMVLCGVCAVSLMLRRLARHERLFPTNDAQDAATMVDGAQREAWVAQLVVHLFVGEVQVHGTEYLPSRDPARSSPAPIFIANHASQIDTAVVYFLERRFRWLAKHTVRMLPGVGLLMMLSGHVFIERRTKNGSSGRRDRHGRGSQPDSRAPAPASDSTTSARNVYLQSGHSIQQGVPMFFFPQGTRCMTAALPFKDGAFLVAHTHRTTLIPVSIDIPPHAWNSAYPLSFSSPQRRPIIVLTIHPPVPVRETDDIEQIKQQCFDIIYRALPPLPSAMAGSTSTLATDPKKTS